MAKYTTLTSLFTAIANSLRGKTGGTGTIVADDFPSVIDSLSTGGITPSGSIEITENGTHDVTNYASAIVNVSSAAQNFVTRTITLDAVAGANTTIDLLTNDDFIKAHYADNGFFVCWYLTTPVTSATGLMHFNYQGNANIGPSNLTRTGVGIKSTSASAAGVVAYNTAINGKGYASHMRVASDGSLKQYLATGVNLAAGTYIITMGVAE